MWRACCMNQHATHKTQPSAHTHTADVDQHSLPSAPFEQSDQPDEAVQHCLQAGDTTGDAVAHTFRVQQSLSAGELSLEVLTDLGPLLGSVEVPEHAMVLNTMWGENGAAAVRQMWHYNDLGVLSRPDYLGPECEAKLAFALLHGTDPQLVTSNALH